ncbi:MAG: COX15/CtaA family protein [Pseudomonadota bacterium]|mgnify:CR=1 FL=1
MNLIAIASPSPTTRRGSSLFILLVSASTLLVFVVVVLSAYLRLAGSGLGCENWPACYAVFKPEGGAWQDIAALRVPIPAWATLTHRLVATVLGVFIFGITIMAIARRRESTTHVLIALILLGLTIFLSVLGYITPSPLLPWVTLSNLLGGMAMLALLWWLGQRLTGTAPGMTDASVRLRPWVRLGLVVLLLQITLGGWVSANYAAAVCPALPGCEGWLTGSPGNSFNPARTLGVTPQGAVIADENTQLLHMVHRLGAVAAFLYLGWLGWRVARLGKPWRTTAIVLLVFLLLQVLLGIAMVALRLPLSLVTTHNAMAALLLLTLVNLNHLLPSGARSA